MENVQVQLEIQQSRILSREFLAMFVAIGNSTALAQEAPGGRRCHSGRRIGPHIWVIAFVGPSRALVFAYRFFQMMIASDPGNDRMQEIAGYVREGANAYLRQQYMVVAVILRRDRDHPVDLCLCAGRAEPLGALCLPDGRFLLWSGRLDRHEDGDVGQQPDRGRGPEVTQCGICRWPSAPGP